MTEIRKELGQLPYGEFTISAKTLRYSGEKPETKRQAWEITLTKWRIILEYWDSLSVSGTGGRSTCGLCMLFWWNPGCANCPVADSTGLEACRGTPYEGFEGLGAGRRNAEAEWEFLSGLAREDGYEDLPILSLE